MITKWLPDTNGLTDSFVHLHQEKERDLSLAMEYKSLLPIQWSLTSQRGITAPRMPWTDWLRLTRIHQYSWGWDQLHPYHMTVSRRDEEVDTSTKQGLVGKGEVENRCCVNNLQCPRKWGCCTCRIFIFWMKLSSEYNLSTPGSYPFADCPLF